MPGAFSGSVCGRGLRGKPASTIGFERCFNRAFSIESGEVFLDYMLREIPLPPVNAAANRVANMGLLELGSNPHTDSGAADIMVK